MTEKYFYKKLEPLNKTQCQAQCIFDEENLCHFSLIYATSGACYLGTFTDQFNGTVDGGSLGEENVTIYLTKGNICSLILLFKILISLTALVFLYQEGKFTMPVWFVFWEDRKMCVNFWDCLSHSTNKYKELDSETIPLEEDPCIICDYVA